MNYLLDTNILLIYIRDKASRAYIERAFDPFAAQNNPIISVVTIGEIKSIAKRNRWGNAKLEKLMNILNTLIVADINVEEVIEMYAELDAYSQDKLPEKRLGLPARNMGKNDLWIAVTAKVANATLLTTDKDFEHLREAYLDVQLIET